MAMPGPTELIIIFLIVLVIFGASRLPQIGKGLGEGIRNFKAGVHEGPEEIDVTPPRSDEAADAAETPKDSGGS
jgi:sec-independent protein translocase protein TatA